MEKSKLNQTVEELKTQHKYFQNQIEFQVLEKWPFLIEVGALTVSTDETGKVITQNSNHPTQFTQKAVDEILTMTFKDGNGKIVIPKVYTRIEWYKEKLDVLTEAIKQFEPLLITNY